MKKSLRTCIIPFRVTPEEKTKIIEKAFTSYREPSMYLRDCALNKQIIVVPGADAVAVGSAIFSDPSVVAKVYDGIADYCAAHGFGSVRELKGALEV